MSKPLDMHRAAFELLDGVQALRLMVDELAGVAGIRFDRDGADEMQRDTLIFVLRAMAEKTEDFAMAYIEREGTPARALAPAAGAV